MQKNLVRALFGSSEWVGSESNGRERGLVIVIVAMEGSLFCDLHVRNGGTARATENVAITCRKERKMSVLGLSGMRNGGQSLM